MSFSSDLLELEHGLPPPARQNLVAQMLAEPARSITPVNPSDPARIGYPATFPIEIALRTASTRQICEAYGIDEDEWEVIRHEPLFLDDLARAVELVKQEGMSFKLKAQLQAAEILKTSWRLVHDANTPPNVRADLIKSTVRWAGYDNNGVGRAEVNGAPSTPQFAIQINFQGTR